MLGTVIVNGQPAPADSANGFSTTIDVTPGLNSIEIEATDYAKLRFQREHEGRWRGAAV